MKQLFAVCFLICSLTSCSVDSDIPTSYSESLPIESVEIPSEFVLGEVYSITLSYFRPSGCYVFADFYYAIDGNERTVAIINTVYPDANCTTFTNELVDASFNFIANQTGSYVFKFWQGKDEEGNDTYYIVEVPVVE